MAFDIQSARKAGYSDQEIAEHLTQSSPNYDVKGAIQSGYSLDEIANEIQFPTNTKQGDGTAWSTGVERVKQKEGFFPKVWEAATIPEAVSREGLSKLANAVPSFEPTGNTFRDMTLNTPKIAAETLAEVAPGFASRGAMVMGGGAKVLKMGLPVLSAVGKTIGRGAETVSGLSYKTPGVLAETFKNPGLLFAKGRESAGKLYEAAQDSKGIRKVLKGPLTESQFVDKALEIAKTGALTADEALEARKALDGIKNTLASRGYKATREFFDNIAKTKFKDADQAYSRATKAEALRSFLPMNKGGTPSIVKSGVMGLVSPLAPFLSPIAQGTAAAALGTIAKPILPTLGTKLPYVAGAVRSVLNRR